MNVFYHQFEKTAFGTYICSCLTSYLKGTTAIPEQVSWEELEKEIAAAFKSVLTHMEPGDFLQTPNGSYFVLTGKVMPDGTIQK